MLGRTTRVSLYAESDEEVLTDAHLDHNVVFVPYYAADDADTMDALFRAEKEEVDSKYFPLPTLAKIHTSTRRVGQGLDGGGQGLNSAQVSFYVHRVSSFTSRKEVDFVPPAASTPALRCAPRPPS